MAMVEHNTGAKPAPPAPPVAEDPPLVGGAEPAELTEAGRLEGWLEAAQAGDPDAFCVLARAHQDRLFQQALALCGHAGNAEDLLAETLIEAWKSLSRFQGRCRFSTWLYAILLHRHQKAIRRAASRPLAPSQLPVSDDHPDAPPPRTETSADPTPAQAAIGRELQVLLHAAIDRLPPPQREVLRLRFFEDASLVEIAAALDCALGTVKSRLHHGLDRLRRHPEILNLVLPARDPCL